MKTNIHFFVISRSIILELKMFQTKVVEELETQILCSIYIFFFFFRNSCRLCGKIL